MDKVILQAERLKESLCDLPEMKEYLHLKELFETDERLINLRRHIAELTSQGREEEKKSAMQEYNAEPIVNNYMIAREEVISLLREIQAILSE